MILHVDQGSAVAPYEQLREQVTALVLGGALMPGARLPSIRQLANDLALAGGTVARAYRELEIDGVVTTRGRNGTVIAGPPGRLGSSPELLSLAREYALKASEVGASVDHAISAVRLAYAMRRLT